MKYLPSEIEINGVTYYSGLELASKQLDWYNLGLAAGKSESYDKGFTKGYEEGFEEGKSEGYEIGKKANGISNKEIPGEYLSHIEEARLEGYKEGYSDAKEGGQAEGYTDGPEQTEYAKGYEEGYAEGKEAGFEEGFMNLRFLIKK